MLDTLQRLFQKGVRFGTVIDIGCADGSFFLELLDRGLVPGASSLNVDANSLYEESLSEIASVVGGEYWIGAVTDREGEMELTTSVHPYWASLRPKDDPYWELINGLSGERVKVPATTLDQLVKRSALSPQARCPRCRGKRAQRRATNPRQHAHGDCRGRHRGLREHQCQNDRGRFFSLRCMPLEPLPRRNAWMVLSDLSQSKARPHSSARILG